ncbi:MAG: glycosyltransferase family 2 protein [Solirubrobacterales bacterium]
MPNPALSVIVPVRDGAEELRKLLESLARQTLPRDRFETIVVDNASRDRSASVARDLGAKVVTEPVPSRARARNAGVTAASGNRFAFVDADCVATPGWLEALDRIAGSSPLIAGAVQVTMAEPPNAVERFESLWRFEQGAWVTDGWAATANLLVDREAFEAVGGFDPAYRSIGEDADFCLRAGRAGYGISYCADAVIEHPAEEDLWPMLKRSFWHGYSSAHVARRIGAGYVAWRRPRPLMHGERAATAIGISSSRVPSDDWATMRRLSRLAYAMRVAGSLWSELRRAR